MSHPLHVVLTHSYVARNCSKIAWETLINYANDEGLTEQELSANLKECEDKAKEEWKESTTPPSYRKMKSIVLDTVRHSVPLMDGIAPASMARLSSEINKVKTGVAEEVTDVPKNTKKMDVNSYYEQYKIWLSGASLTLSSKDYTTLLNNINTFNKGTS